MKSSLLVPKQKDGKVWNETIPFNPLLLSWEFEKACCCEIDFTRGELKMIINSKKNRLKVFKNKEQILSYYVPQDQIEFHILQSKIDGVNTK